MELERLKIDRGTASARARRRRAPWGRLLFFALVFAGAFLFRHPLLAAFERWRLPEVEAARAVRADAAAAIANAGGTAANGYVVARRRAALSADTPGRIVELNVQEGTVVKKGDVVARLFADEAEAALERARAELSAGNSAVKTAEARVAAAERRLEEAQALVTSAEATRDEAEAALALAEKDFQRSQELIDSGAVTRERFDQSESGLVQARARKAAAAAGLVRAESAVTTAQSDVAVAHAEVEQSQAQLPALAAARDFASATLDKTFVRAPFDGVIVLKDAEVGEVVSPNAQGGQSRGSVATMVDFASLEVQVELPETSLGAVALGQAAEVYLDAFTSERFDGEVLRIWPTANRQKATVEIRIGLKTIDPRMRPEMGARVVFVPEPAAGGASVEPLPEGALLVPRQAVATREGARGVFRIDDDGRVRFQALSVGAERGARVVVEGGLDPASRFVAAPGAELNDGDRVRVKGETP